MTQLADFAALFASARVVDLSPLIENGMPRWPTHPPLVINPTVTHEHDGYYCQTLFLAEHTGAHVDAPAHIHPDMMEHTVDTLAPDALIGKASVFDLSNLGLEAGDLVDAGDLARIESGHTEPLGAGDVVLLNYGWLRRFWKTDRRWLEYAENAPGLTEDAILRLADKNVRAVGADTIACDQPLRDGVALQKSYGHEDYFLPRHVYIIEALSNLHLLPPRCFFVGIPLKISRGSGSPIRPLALIFDEGQWLRDLLTVTVTVTYGVLTFCRRIPYEADYLGLETGRFNEEQGWKEGGYVRMTTPSDGLTSINVVPHFSRLHEWIALEEGYFHDEGLEPHMLTDVMHSVSSHRGDEYGQRPQDLPFVQGEEVANSACEWGTACNAGAGMGRVVPDLYSVGRYAIFVRPGSGIERLYELRDVPIGIGEMAGSHFTTLKTLGEVLPKEHIKTVHTGGPGERLVALLNEEVEAANLLDPEIPIAEARGLRKLAQGEFVITFWVSPTMSREILGKFFGALRLAEEALERDTENYLHLWRHNIAPSLEGDYDYATFGRGEKLIFEPYSLKMFEDAMQFAETWGLHEHVRESNYDRLVAPLSI